MKRTKTFHVDYYSELEDKNYEGTFTVKKLTIGDISRMGVLKAKLAGGFSYDAESGRGVDPTTDAINEMLCHCELALLKKPDWFVPEDFVDAGLLRAVYQEVVSFETNFRSGGVSGKKSDGSGSDTSEAQSEGGGGADGSLENLVDKKVPKISTVG